MSSAPCVFCSSVATADQLSFDFARPGRNSSYMRMIAVLRDVDQLGGAFEVLGQRRPAGRAGDVCLLAQGFRW